MRSSRLLTLLLAMAAAYPVPAVAADGSFVSSYSSGAWQVDEYLLCDGDHTATDCTEFDLHRETSGGLPSYATVDLRRSTCSGAVTVDLRGLTDPLGFPAIIQQLTVAGVSSVTLDPQVFRHVDGVVGTRTGCTDLEVVVRLFYPRLRPN